MTSHDNTRSILFLLVCTTGENNCHDFANCVWLGTTFECRCNTGFQGNGRNPNGCTGMYFSASK